MAKRPKLYYRDTRTGRFTKQGRKYAKPAGVIYEGKRYPASPGDLQAKAFMRGDKERPDIRYTSRGRFIPEKAAKHFMRSKFYKEMNEKKEAEFSAEAKQSDVMAENVPFYNILEVFKSDYIEIFGFNNCKILGDDWRIHEPVNERAALARVKAEGYVKAQKVKAANKRGDGTPPDMFATIYMGKPGDYLIDFTVT